jgi:hypothetical protein
MGIPLQDSAASRSFSAAAPLRSLLAVVADTLIIAPMLSLTLAVV